MLGMRGPCPAKHRRKLKRQGRPRSSPIIPGRKPILGHTGVNRRHTIRMIVHCPDDADEMAYGCFSVSDGRNAPSCHPATCAGHFGGYESGPDGRRSRRRAALVTSECRRWQHHETKESQ